MVGHGGVQAAMVLEQDLRVFNTLTHRQEEVVSDTGWYFEHIWDLKIPPQQWHTFSNKTTPSPTRPHIPIVLLPISLWESIVFKLPHIQTIFPFCNYPDPNKIQVSYTLIPGDLWGETGKLVSVQANRKGARIKNWRIRNWVEQGDAGQQGQCLLRQQQSTDTK